MTINDILDAIDHALDDYEVSADAMRWKPEPVRVDADVQPFLDAIRRDVHELVALQREGPVITLDSHGALIRESDWWVRWLDATTQADRR